MASSIFSDAHQDAIAVLAEARRAAGLKQADLARELGRHQSRVSTMENHHRRVDVVEFLLLAEAIGRDPVELFTEFVRRARLRRIEVTFDQPTPDERD